MAVSIKPIFAAADGATFATPELAERRNALLEARQRFSELGAEVVKALGAAGITADGFPFDVTRSRDYWYVARRFDGGLPVLVTVNVWPHFAQFDVECERGVIRVYQPDRRDHVNYRLDEFYHNKLNARVARIAACEERLAELRAEFEQIKAER